VRVDAALDDADEDDDDGDFTERHSSEEARAGEELVGGGRRLTFEQREHAIMLSQIHGILVQFTVYDGHTICGVR
jgi:hypothetical protein